MLIDFVAESLKNISIIAGIACTFFVAKGGLLYITSSGEPQALERAKLTIRNALIGLIIVIAASTFSTILTSSFGPHPELVKDTLPSIEVVKTPELSLGKILEDAISGLINSIIKSAKDPITSAINGFLRLKPEIVSNETIFKFWTVIVGITDTLFALMIGLIGLQYMSASSFGFEEIELKQILPRIGLAFLGANVSIFIIDWLVTLNSTLIETLFENFDGDKSILAILAKNPATTLFINILMVLFIILAIALLIFYITRLIIIAIGVVLSPLFFLLWATPKYSDFADISLKTYLATIFSTFVHSVILLLGISFLNVIPGDENILVPTLLGIGTMMILLKSSSTMMYLVTYNNGRSLVKQIGGQIMNVISSSHKVARRGSKA